MLIEAADSFGRLQDLLRSLCSFESPVGLYLSVLELRVEVFQEHLGRCRAYHHRGEYEVQAFFVLRSSASALSFVPRLLLPTPVVSGISRMRSGVPWCVRRSSCTWSSACRSVRRSDTLARCLLWYFFSSSFLLLISGSK